MVYTTVVRYFSRAEMCHGRSISSCALEFAGSMVSFPGLFACGYIVFVLFVFGVSMMIMMAGCAGDDGGSVIVFMIRFSFHHDMCSRCL